MNERVRNVLLGLALGFGVLLLLDLAQQLRRAAVADAAASTLWWSYACYLAVGVVLAYAVAATRRDRLVPGMAAVLLGLVTLVAVPVSLSVPLLTRLPLMDAATADTGVVLLATGALAFAALRGTRM